MSNESSKNQAVYAVATDGVSDSGHQLYTIHQKRVPNADNWKLFVSQPAEQPRGAPVGSVMHDPAVGATYGLLTTDLPHGTKLYIAHPKPEQDHSRDATKMIGQAVGDGVTKTRYTTEDAWKHPYFGRYKRIVSSVVNPMDLRTKDRHALTHSIATALVVEGITESEYATRPAVATPAEVTSIKRYDVEYQSLMMGDGVKRPGATMRENPRGAFVSYSDHVAALTAQCQVRKDGGVTDDVGEPVTQKLDKALGDLSNAVEDIETGKHQSAVLSFLRSVREYVEDARADIAAIASPSAGAAVPEGWKLVPVEPTQDMVVEGFERAGNFTDSDEFEEMSGCQGAAETARVTWRAMLAAAPEVPRG